MERPLRLLIVDDQYPDAELSALQIARGGYPCTWRRVETEADFSMELREFAPDLILSDFTLPQFDGLSAFELALNQAPGVPFIFVSGTIGEKRATEALARGAADYVSKDDLTRLVPAVARVMTDARANAVRTASAKGLQQSSEALPMVPGANTTNASPQLNPLTALPTRACFCEHVGHLLRNRIEQDAVTTVILFNIDHLGDINDFHGRDVGDSLLRSVAERLRRRFGEGNHIAHFGGGRFAAVFDEHRKPRDTPHDSATAVFGQPFSIGGCPSQATVKCGLARYPEDGRDAETLLKYAEGALGRNRERQQMSPQVLVHRKESRPEGGLEQRLRLALKQQEFLVYYQPLIERVSGRIVAVEALLRWRDPDHGVISPGAFMPALEQSGLIGPVGEWVISQAVRDCIHWSSIGLPKIRVAVNISRMELSRKGFAGYFLDAARMTRACSGIDIEIRESALLEAPGNIRQTLRNLRAEGVRVAIDDFGADQASLTRLSEFPVDSLKIDRMLISQLSEQPQSQAVIATIIASARACGLRTVAEGVETIQQLKILDTLGCEQSQGYLHSPAVSAEEFEFLLAARASGAEADP